jgi:hypothetical protein
MLQREQRRWPITALTSSSSRALHDFSPLNDKITATGTANRQSHSPLALEAADRRHISFLSTQSET